MRGQAAALLLVAASACAPSWKYAPHDERFQTSEEPRLHAMPTPNPAFDWWDLALHSTVLPLGRLLSPSYYLDMLSSGRPALDINAFGEVADSTWYHNRISRRQLSPAELRRGPNQHPPDLDNALTVVAGKIEGASAGLVVLDHDGTTWFLKFDPPANPEMTTAAEMVGTRIMWAAGYNVPETYLVDLDLSRLDLDPGARTRDDYNRSVPLTEAKLHTLLTQLNPDRAGRLRAIMSRAVPGRNLGPFSYRRIRPDDPNDIIPHQRRRSLRGLGFLSAWINNTDTRRQNTLDTFIPISSDGRRGYVRHYLLDFGDSLGATATHAKYVSEGYEHRVDWTEIGKRTISFGLKYPYWYAVKRSPFRSVGIFEAKVFDPARWRPQYSNPAFRAATIHDNFWAATILARFTPELIAAAVASADYSEPRAAEWVNRVLAERRTKLLRHIFARMLALVDPVISADYVVTMTDLEVTTGLTPAPPSYRWKVRWNRTASADIALGHGTAPQPQVDLREAVRKVMSNHKSGFERDPFVTLTLRRSRSDPAVELHLRVVRDHLVPVAIEREVGRVAH